MSAASERYVIGIDLGTTHSSVAAIDLEDPAARLELLAIPQWENEAEIITDGKLPSFLWLLSKNQLKKGLKPHPAAADRTSSYIVGRAARDQALAEPMSVVHSAKSWLSTGTTAHRLAKILPWGSSGDKLSPLEVQTALLEHLRISWNAAHPTHRLEEQRVVITVPASFDELAQRLTLEAAMKAGYPVSVELLEEPLAAYYDWEARNTIEQGRILVCDIGGGTSDFTLLQRTGGRTERLKVSEHLLLGGDNIDLALAYRLAAKLTSEELPRAAWNMLLAQARRLKEEALSHARAETFHISIPLNVNQLFGSYLSGSVEADEIRNWVLEDFFASVPVEARPEKNAGLQAFGLPYAKDGQILRHLAEFVDGETIDCILCVGGTLRPEVLTERLHQVVSSWQSQPVRLLPLAESDLAIAYGAARFAYLRAQAKDLIHSPYPRNLWLEVEDQGSGRAGSSVLLIPKGQPRMSPYRVALDGLLLRLGEDVRFQVLAEQNDGTRQTMPPLVSKLASKGKKGAIPVRVEALVRETGVLEVSCHAVDSIERWTLDFALEASKPQVDYSHHIAIRDVPKLEEARALIRRYFARETQSQFRVDTLPTALESLFDLKRDEWSADHLRGLWPALEAIMFQRAATADHEAMWFYLAGYALRPGYGYLKDDERVKSLLRVYDESFRRVEASAKLLAQWWILWRRTAGGLDAAFQRRLYERYVPVLRKEKDASPELIRLLGSLERLDPSTKDQLGRLLLNQLRAGVKVHAETRIWALARLGSRYPLYAGVDAIVAPSIVESWADELETVSLPPKVRATLFYAWAGRVRGDKQYDLDPRYRALFLDKVDHPEWRKAMQDVVVPDLALEAAMLSDSLPSGFILARETN